MISQALVTGVHALPKAYAKDTRQFMNDSINGKL